MENTVQHEDVDSGVDARLVWVEPELKQSSVQQLTTNFGSGGTDGGGASTSV